MQTANLIGGEWVRAASGKTLRVTDPATDELVGETPSLGAGEVRQAIDAANGAWGLWRAKTAGERGALVRRLGELMRRDAERLARLMTSEQGKPLAESRGEIEYAVSFLEWAAEEGKRLDGDIIPASTTSKRILVIRQPVGVAAIITPWNFPSAMITRKLGPALACGCTVVIKPAEDTPLSAIAIGELAVEAGIPAGVVNIVTGDAATIGDAFFEDDRVRKLSFTGSTEVGRLLMGKAARNLMRLSMELGGHAPFIVFDDADLDKAVAAAVACKVRTAGQTCICANRFYVQGGIYDAFMARFAKAIEGLKVGRGTAEGCRSGRSSTTRRSRRWSVTLRTRKSGGKVMVGGSRVRIQGLADRFYAPTLIDGMTPEMLVHREETFWPGRGGASVHERGRGGGVGERLGVWARVVLLHAGRLAPDPGRGGPGVRDRGGE
ncbi:MAG: aldehyde dehydrogenase family protein [Phycisphaerales bacterium]